MRLPFKTFPDPLLDVTIAFISHLISYIICHFLQKKNETMLAIEYVQPRFNYCIHWSLHVLLNL